MLHTTYYAICTIKRFHKIKSWLHGCDIPENSAINKILFLNFMEIYAEEVMKLISTDLL